MSQKSQMSQMSHGEGNTKLRSRRLIFVLNNPEKDDCLIISEFLTSKDAKFIIGDEVGEQGTPHLQGYVEFKNQIRFETLKNFNPKIHWEKAFGNRKQNIDYCSKQKILKCTFDKSRKQQILEDDYNNVIWKPWQEQVLNIIKNKPDKRKIHWFWDEYGNVGKSYLFKYIVCKYDPIICDGKKDNVFNQIKIWLECHKETEHPEIIILDIPKSGSDYVNYSVIEQVKNGCIYSGKYEGGVCVYKIPHIIVFANFEPPRGAWSQDRYDTILINE